MFLKCEVDILCISTLGKKKLLNICLMGNLHNNRSPGRVECVTTIWDREKFHQNKGKGKRIPKKIYSVRTLITIQA